MEGSISHSRLAGEGVALCAVRPGQEGIGLDLEAWLDGDQGAQLWPGIMDGEEWGRLEAGAHDAQLSLAEGLTLVFSAKESLFKALYPLVLTRFYFHDAELLSWSEEGRAELRLLIDLSTEWPAGSRLNGRFAEFDGYLLSLVAIAAESVNMP